MILPALTSDSLKEQYNWGYDPYNYNVPEGSYSTDPFDGAVSERVQGDGTLDS